MRSPLTTVAIPTCDRPDMLMHAVRSCLAQTQDDFEVVVSDNCSATPAAPLLAALGDPRVRVVTGPRRLAATDNWNRCLAAARGKYIAFLCDDDVLLPNYLEEMIADITAEPDCALATCPWDYVNPALQVIQSPWRALWRFYPRLDGDDFVLHVMGQRRPLTLSGTLCSTAGLRAVGGFREVGFGSPWAADHFAFFQVALASRIVRSAVTPLFLYRLHGANISDAAGARGDGADEYCRSLEALRSRFRDPEAFTAAMQRYTAFLKHIPGQVRRNEDGRAQEVLLTSV